MPSKNKKNLDIIPPQFSVVPPGSFKKEPAEELSPRKSPVPFFVVICAVILLAGASAYFFIPQKVEIAILPKMEQVSFETTKEIVGRFIPEEEAAPGRFYLFGTREKETRAEGIIRVHNDFHLEQYLLPNTRFWCGGEEATEFTTKEEVTIPSGSYLDVEVVASSPGEELNIPPCKVFSVPGLSGSPRYTAVYGESLSPMEGGGSVEEALVVEKSQMEDLAREHILQQISQDRRIKDDSLEVNYSLSSADLEEKKIVLDLEMEASIYSLPDEESFKKAVRGAEFAEMGALIAAFPEVAEINLEWWPFWVSRVPEDTASIDIYFIFDNMNFVSHEPG